MTNQLNQTNTPATTSNVPLAAPSKTADRTGDLVSKMIDEQLSEEETRELEALLEQDADARTAYVESMRLHVALLELCGGLPSVHLPNLDLGS